MSVRSGVGSVFRTPLRTSRILREMADETNDARDHDELHAASIIVLTPVRKHPYIHRWIEGLLPEGGTITGREEEMHDST